MIRNGVNMKSRILHIKKHARQGFTLIELICVVALLAILTAMCVPTYHEVQKASAEKVAQANARTNYSIGKANDAVLMLDPAAETEAYLGDRGEQSYDGSHGRWHGKINGKEYEGVYEGI